MALGGIFGFVVVILLVVVVIIFRKKIVVLAMDLFIATIVYLGALFFVSWMGLKVPILLAEWGYPIMLVFFVIYHIVSNLSKPSTPRPLAGL